MISNKRIRVRPYKPWFNGGIFLLSKRVHLLCSQINWIINNELRGEVTRVRSWKVQFEEKLTLIFLFALLRRMKQNCKSYKGEWEQFGGQLQSLILFLLWCGFVLGDLRKILLPTWCCISFLYSKNNYNSLLRNCYLFIVWKVLKNLELEDLIYGQSIIFYCYSRRVLYGQGFSVMESKFWWPD